MGRAAIGCAGTGRARVVRVGTGQAKIGRLGTSRSGTGRSRKKLQWTLVLVLVSAVFGHLGAIWGPFGHPKRYVKACKWRECLAKCLSLKISS
jgi:hypothetical protein